MKYQFIFEQREHPEKKWADILGVSRSGYYDWKRTRAEREANEAKYVELVREIFKEGKGTYGANRICGIMRKRGYKGSFYKVRNVMESEGLRCLHCNRRQRSLTNSKISRGVGYPNLIRGLTIKEPFQVLSRDISYIRTGEGFDYLCQIRDVKSGGVLAESMSERMKTELVTKTIKKCA